MDQYASPQSESSAPPPTRRATLDLKRVLSEAVGAFLANIVSSIAILLGAILLLMLAAVPCGVLLPIAVPLLAWAYTQWTLDAHAGSGRAMVLFEPGEDWLKRIGTVWVYMVSMAVVYLPLAAVWVAVMFPPILDATATGTEPDVTVPTVVLWGVAALYSFLIVRLALSMFIVVDAKLGAIAAIQRSWDVTRGHWLKLIGLQLLALLAAAPTQIANLLMNNSPAKFSLILVLVLPALWAVSWVTSTVTMLAWASVYRQLDGRPA